MMISRLYQIIERSIVWSRVQVTVFRVKHDINSHGAEVWWCGLAARLLGAKSSLEQGVDWLASMRPQKNERLPPLQMTP